MKKILTILAILFLMPAVSHAFFLLDTGTPDESIAWLMGNDGLTQYSLASRFNLSQQSLLTNIEGYFWEDPIYATAGTLDIVLYAGDAVDVYGGSPIPNTTNEVFRNSITINNVSHNDFLAGGWHGTGNINETLNAGSYWVAFEGTSVSTYLGAMPGISPNSLANDAWQDSYSNGYNFNDPTINGPLGLGVRISGNPVEDPNVVPEPSSVFLLMTGLAGMYGKRLKNFISKPKVA